MANLKNISLTIGIAVLFALFIGFAIDAFYGGPEHENFCQQNMREKYPYPKQFNESACPQLNFKDPIYEACTQDKGYVAYDIDENGCSINPYCETCQVQFDAANQKYSRNIFFITAVIGIIAIIAGLLYVHIDPIASGFMFGGILVLIYGTIRVFGNLSKVMRVVVLGIELIVLVYIGVKTIKRGRREK